MDSVIFNQLANQCLNYDVVYLINKEVKRQLEEERRMIEFYKQQVHDELIDKGYRAFIVNKRNRAAWRQRNEIFLRELRAKKRRIGNGQYFISLKKRRVNKELKEVTRTLFLELNKYSSVDNLKIMEMRLLREWENGN